MPSSQDVDEGFLFVRGAIHRRLPGEGLGNDMSYRYERYERYNERPRRGRNCLITLVVLVWLIFLGGLLIRYIAVPAVANSLRERFAQRLPQQQAPSGDAQVPTAPGGVAMLPNDPQPGTFPIPESDANAWIQSNKSQLRGIDDVRLRFIPGEVQADVTVAGVTSTAHAGAQVVDGQVIVTNPRLDPPLGYVIDVAPFAQLIQERLNRDFATTGRTITGLTIEQGQLIIAVK